MCNDKEIFLIFFLNSSKFKKKSFSKFLKFTSESFFFKIKKKSIHGEKQVCYSSLGDRFVDVSTTS